MKHQPIVIIGAGIGGLSAAIQLAAAGKRVVVLEQNAQVGGKMGEFRQDGFRWDTGPSVITMRPVFEELFQSAGRRMADYLTLLPLEPITRYFYPDGIILNLSRDFSRTASQIAGMDDRDLEGYLSYLAYAAAIYRVAGKVFIFDQPPTLASFFKIPLKDYAKVDPFRTMHQAICSFVHSPHLRQLLGRFATYVGASPYLAPATLNVIAHVELTGGVWYPQGGIYSIARACARLAEELGVELSLNTRVEKILVRDGQAHGVVCSEGQVIEASAVIANLDVATVYERLLPGESLPRRQVLRLTRAEPSCSGFALLLGVKGTYPQLAHHNIFFSEDYDLEFHDIFRRKIPPHQPTIYLAITSKTDSSHAPPGCENWFVLINVPALGGEFDWASQAEGYADLVIDRLSRFVPGVKDQILTRHLLTPLDIERLTSARRGALYGLSSNFRMSAFKRPHNRCRDICRLYFVGGTAHPGGGVPMVMLSGKVAAGFVLDDL